MKAFRKAEVLPKPELREMFDHVYEGEEPWILVSATLSVQGLIYTRGLMTSVHCRRNRERSSAGSSRSMATSGARGRPSCRNIRGQEGN